MKKNAALKKLCSEEITVLKTEYLIFLSLILLISAANRVTAQVPINGFCQYEKFPVVSHYKNIFTLNFNKDSYTDIAIFNPDNVQVIIYKGGSGEKITEPVINNLPCRISAIHHIKNRLQNNYVFISRKDRLIGLLEISEAGKIKIISSKKVGCYPENISVADVNGDGIEEVLVSGCSYEGLSIFRIRENVFEEVKISNKDIFSSAVFADLNNDDVPDIAAIDLITNSLKFFYNNSVGNFEFIREIKFPEKISNLKTYDFNLDYYNDLLFLQENSIVVLNGDSISSFRTKSKIPVRNKPYKYIFADFNSDGFNDIAYLDNSLSKISILYSKGHGFYNEIPYLNKPNMTDITAYYSKFIKGIASLGFDANLYLISNVRLIQDKTNITLGIEPDKIKYFDAGNNKIYDFYFLDKSEPYLNIIIRNNSGIPYLYYSLKMLDHHAKVIVDDKLSNKKVFYCYTKEKKLIEIITLNLDSKKAAKEKLYASGPIFDLGLTHENNEERAKIFVAVKKSGNLRVQVFSYMDFRYKAAASDDIVENATDARIIPGIPMEIYYWQTSEKVYSFNKLELNADLKPNYYKNKFSVDKNKGYKIVNFIGDILNRTKNNAINFILSNEKGYAVISGDDKNYKVDLQNPSDSYLLYDESNLFLGEYRFNGLNKLFVYNKSSEALERLDIINKRKMILATKLVDSKNLGSYFIKNLNFKKYHLVYTDKVEKCITIRELNY